jgi:hypothetical protein
MKHKPLKLGFSITLEKGTTWKPFKMEFWNDETHFKQHPPEAPFKYMADALTCLSFIKLNHYVKSPVASPNMDYAFVAEAWKALDPHVELYERSQGRVRSLQSQIALTAPAICKEFEEHFNESFEMALKPNGFDLTALGPLLDTFSWLENKMGNPLLYNFGLNFSKGFLDKLHDLYSFLYHVRSVVALDHNSLCADTSHEGVKVDAITDYLPKAEYVVNDALLYWQFKKLAQPFSSAKGTDGKVDKLFVGPMEKAFHKFSHHACALVDNLPAKFIGSLSPMELEEAFYLVQMDWLLGSPAGLLFKIREEIFGLQNGYEKIFWKDVEPVFHSKPVNLSIACTIQPETVFGKKSA